MPSALTLRTFGVAAFLLVTLSAQQPCAQSVIYSLDLANPQSARPLSAGVDFGLRLDNKAPGAAYVIEVEREIIQVDPIDTSNLFSRGLGQLVEQLAEVMFRTTDASPDAPTPCPLVVLQVTNELRSSGEDVETRVPGLIRDLTNKARENCRPQVEAALVAESQFEVAGSYSLSQGERLVATVTRRDDATRQWRFEFTTGAPGEWSISYGFTYGLMRARSYYLTPVQGQSDAFQIDRAANRGTFDFIPSLVFTYIPRRDALRDFHAGPTFGLGFDLSSPAVFAGIGATYGRNVVATAGVMIHRQTQLAGQFSEGQVISTILGDDRLHDEVYNLNGFVGLSFRFNSNPLAHTIAEGRQAESEAGDQQEEASLDDTADDEPESENSDEGGTGNGEDESETGDTESGNGEDDRDPDEEEG